MGSVIASLTQRKDFSRWLFILIFLLAAFLRIWGIGNFDVSFDEDHYTHDAYRFLTHDPYMVPRHHTFQHAKPSTGHPFLVQFLMIGSYRLFGPTLTSGRLVSVLANLVALVGAFYLAYLLYGKKTAFLTMLFLTILPHDVRYARDAHLDAVMGATAVWATICFWKVLTTRSWKWGMGLGVMTALVLATKINGPFIFIFYLLGLVGYTRIGNTHLWLSQHWKQLVWAVGVCGVVFFLLIAPDAYLDGIIHPSDPSFQNPWRIVTGVVFYGFTMVQRIVLYLYTIPFAILVITGLFLAMRRRQPQGLLLFSMWVAFSHVFFTHGGISGEYGYLMFNPYWAILAAVAYLKLGSTVRMGFISSFILMAVPLLILHGLRLDIGSMGALTPFNDSNYRYGQMTMRQAVWAINALPGKPVVLWVKDDRRPLPMLELSGNVSLGPFMDIKQVNTILVSEPSRMLELVQGDFYIYQTLDNPKDIRIWILRRRD